MHTCQLEESKGTWAHGWQHIHNNSHHSHPVYPPSSSFSSHLLPLLSAPSSLNDNPTLEILTLYNPTTVALRRHWLKGALLVPANLPFHCLKHCLFDRRKHIDVAEGAIEFGRRSVPNYMHDSSCYAASCGCQVRFHQGFCQGTQTTIQPPPTSHTHILKRPPERPLSTYLPHTPSMCLPPLYPFSLHTTLIINDLRDSFHLIY